MKLALSKAAERDLTDIISYGTQVHGWPAAETYARDLEDAMGRLLLYPNLGMRRVELRPGIRSLPCREHLIFYRPSARTVLIVRVLHKAMDAHHWLRG